MGVREAVGSLFREGAAATLGFSERLDRADVMEAALQEVGADTHLLARRAEDVGWRSAFGTQEEGYYKADRHQRESSVERAYRFYFNDPIVKRTVDLITYYTFANGVPKPSYRQNTDDSNVDEQQGKALIDNIWANNFNKAALMSTEAQHGKSLELQLQGNVFLLLIKKPRVTITKGGASPVEIGDISQQEIVDIIPHPGAKKVPLYYKRVFRPKEYDFATDDWRVGEEVTRYYRHWKNEAPTEWDGRPWGPPEDKIAEGYVYHVAVNKTDEMKFGISELTSYTKWAAGLNEYMTSRMSVVMAIAQIALQAQGGRGGPKQVNQIANELQDISRLAQQANATASLDRVPNGNQGVTKAAVTSGGVKIEPIMQDSGSAGAATDVQTFKGQIAAGSGVPVHHLGDIGSANLATATSMDAPLQRLIEARQKLWSDVFENIVGWVMDYMNLDSSRIEQTMPPILARDFSLVASGLAGMITTVDPGVFSRDLVRFYVGEVLDSMGKRNTHELLDKFFPPDWKPPGERAMEQQLAFAAAQGGGIPGGAPGNIATPEEEQQAGAAAVSDAATQNGKSARGASYKSRGTTRSADERGNQDAGASSRDRARAAREVTLESTFESILESAYTGAPGEELPPELSSVIEDTMEEAFADA